MGKGKRKEKVQKGRKYNFFLITNYPDTILLEI